MAGRGSKKTTQSAKRLLAALAVLTVLGLAVFGGYAIAKPSPPSAPSITAKPADPTNSPSASFTYGDTDSVQKFQCSLDNAAFADCGTTNPATKTPAYSGLAAGSHTFQVRAVNANGTSSATSYTWKVDLAAPTVSSINRALPSPTNAVSVSWAVTFSEDVSGVDASDFTLVHGATPTGGAITVTPASGTVSTYAVTAPTGSGDGNLGLNLVDNDSIKDAATNSLGGSGAGNGNFAGQVYAVDKSGPANAPTVTAGPAQNSLVASTSASFSFSTSEAGVAGFQCKLDAGSFEACSSPKSYSSLAQGGHDFSVRGVDALGNPGPASSPLRHWTVDTVAPPAPVLTLKPADPSSTATSKFAWTEAESGTTFQCSIENGPWTGCTSPFTFEAAVDTSNSGQHQFAVRAIDAAGNASEPTTYKWKVVKDSGQNLVINGSVTGLQIGIEKSVPVTINNPNSVPIYVSNINVTLTVSASSGSCTASNFQTTNWTAATAAQELLVPANATNFAVPAADQPKLKLVNLPTNQDVCKSKSFTLTFNGSGHS